jgi:hypothetical protein
MSLVVRIRHSDGDIREIKLGPTAVLQDIQGGRYSPLIPVGDVVSVYLEPPPADPDSADANRPPARRSPDPEPFDEVRARRQRITAVYQGSQPEHVTKEEAE